MIADSPIDDVSVLRRLVANTDTLLLDFDGPVCSVFAGFPAHVVANQLRDILAADNYVELPRDVAKSEDPFDVFKYAAVLGASEATYVERALRAHEVEAVASAVPTSGAHEFMHAWTSSGRRIAIVSNNSDAAVESYLHLHDLTSTVHSIAARTEPDPALLKPNSFMVTLALQRTGASPGTSAMVGDSSTDIEAGIAAGCSVVAYANKAHKLVPFARSPAQCVVTAIKVLAEALD